jgi:hypothetical protein
MDRKIIFLFMFIGGFLGGYVPLLWGGSAFSFSSVFWSGIGGFVGIYIGYRMR